MKRRSLAVFFALAFVLPWAVWGTQIAQDAGWLEWHIPSPLAFWVGLTVATFGSAVLAGGWVAIRDLLSRMVRWRVRARWYLVAVLLTPALALLTMLLSSSTDASQAVGQAVPISGLPLLLAVNVWLFLLTEEAAWRGFALPRLQRIMTPLAAAVVLGVVWGLWHIPLFLTAGSFQSTIPFAGFMLSIVAASVVISWIFNRTRGSVLLAAIFHACTDAAIAYFGVMSAGAASFWIFVGLQCAVALAVAPSLRHLPANHDDLVVPPAGVRSGPTTLSRVESARRLAALGGTDPAPTAPPRRRDEPA